MAAAPLPELSDFKDAETTNPVTSVYAALGRLKAELPELTDGEVKELQLTTQCYAFARVLDGKACVVVLNNGDSPAQLEFQLPVEASSAKDLLAGHGGRTARFDQHGVGPHECSCPPIMLPSCSWKSKRILA